MHLRAISLILLLPGWLCLSGCSGPPIDGRPFQLPGFNAPEQSEPELEDPAADTLTDS
jgi:hypothetical protein